MELTGAELLCRQSIIKKQSEVVYSLMGGPLATENQRRLGVDLYMEPTPTLMVEDREAQNTPTKHLHLTQRPRNHHDFLILAGRAASKPLACWTERVRC